jgi:hypothetical protein
MDLDIRYEAIVYFEVRQCRGIPISVMSVLGGKVDFPVLVFHRFRVIGDKGWTSQSDFGHKDENAPEDCTKENYG